MAHAIDGYAGACKNIHGHSYELHVSLSAASDTDTYIPAPGFEIDFKEIKHLVKNAVVDKFDHKLILSDAFLLKNPACLELENLIKWEVEPSAENLLIYIVHVISEKLSDTVKLRHLKLFETKDSYAEWISG